MNKKIVVLIKLSNGDINPFDECALESALEMDNVDINILCMGPKSYIEPLKKLTRLGCEAILISDPLYAGSDTISTSKILNNAIRKISPDLIFAGIRSLDGATALVPLMLSDLLQYELIGNVCSIKDNHAYSRNDKKYIISERQILTFEKFTQLREPSIFSSTKEIRILNNGDLKMDLKEIGKSGSYTSVVSTKRNDKAKRFVKFIDYQKLDQLINDELKKTRPKPIYFTKKAPEIYYVGDIESVAKKYGEKIYKIEENDIDTISKEIYKKNPEIIIWEENDNIKLLAAQFAIRSNNGLCADCTDFRYIDNKFIITRPASSGNIVADIICTSPISMATIKSESHTYENDIAVIIGMGGVPFIDKINDLANRIHANTYCTRPVVDNGFMPYCKQIGLTGQNIAPKICILFGVSGAIQTIAGIENSQTIIAINNNKNSDIFDYSDYGIVIDIKNMLGGNSSCFVH